jgi:hypothetical protein
MSFLKNIFGKKEQPVTSYAEFWDWFNKNEKEFFNVVKSRSNIEKGFFNKLSPKLAALKDGYFFVTGMYNDNTAELVLTADGNTCNIVFVEELTAAAPQITDWKFTALKPPLDIKDVYIQMSGYKFSNENISFYSNDTASYPDEIDITVVHSDCTEENKSTIAVGTQIFLDNFLGELDFLTTIDRLNIIGPGDAVKELIPIEKLKPFLTWRQKEFVEKYEGMRYDTEHDNFSMLEAELQSGNALVAVINTDLLKWDNKASHPWVSVVTITYDGSRNNGMPNEKDLTLLNEIEEEILQELKDIDGHLNIGHQTAESEREIYFASKDFRMPSKIFYAIQQKYADKFAIKYDIYKDKYWQSFERFTGNE